VNGGTMLLMVSALDNMVKGAAGQAVQNMNLLCGFPEADGIDQVPAAF
jgi:N-acetyl-gamma-glutamyl-phosphate reductase